MPRERLAPWIAAAVIGVIAIAGIGALIVQAFDDDDGDETQLISIERDGSKLRLELDLEALGLDEDDIAAFEDDALNFGELNFDELGLALLQLLPLLGFEAEDLDFERGSFDSLRDLFGDRDGSEDGDRAEFGELSELGEQLRRLLEDRERNGGTGLAPLLERLREQAPTPDLDRFEFRIDPRPLLGVSVDNELAVIEVTPGSAADAAGVEHGDVIRSVDGHAVANIGELREAIAAVEPSSTYELDLVRGDALVTLEVDRPEGLTGTNFQGLDIDLERLRGLIEGLRSGRIDLEDVPEQIRPLLQRLAPLELTPQ